MSTHLEKRDPPYIALPDRPEYSARSLRGRLRAVFLHALDECVAFFRVDWRAIVLAIVFQVLGLVFSYFLRGEATAMSDAQSIAVTVGLPPIAAAFVLYVWGLVKAPHYIKARNVVAELNAVITEQTKALTAERERLRDTELALSQADARATKLSDELAQANNQRPRLKLSALLVNTDGGTWVTQFEVQNFGDAVAVNVRSEITIPDTGYAIRFELTRVPKGSPMKFLPDLLTDGKAWLSNDVWQVEKFMEEARQAFLERRGAEANERLRSHTSADRTSDMRAVSDELSVAIGDMMNPPMQLGPSLTVNFNVTYSNFDRTRMYSTPHVLTYIVKRQTKWQSASLELESPVRIDLADIPEPIPVAATPPAS